MPHQRKAGNKAGARCSLTSRVGFRVDASKEPSPCLRSQGPHGRAGSCFSSWAKKSFVGPFYLEGLKHVFWTPRLCSCFEASLPSFPKPQPVITEVGGRENIILMSFQIFWLTQNNSTWYNRGNPTGKPTRFKFLISKVKAGLM